MAEHERALVEGMFRDLDQHIADDPRDRAGKSVDDLDKLARRGPQEAGQRRLTLQSLGGSLLPFVHKRIIPAGTPANRPRVRSA